jgi:hypothetical protein
MIYVYSEYNGDLLTPEQIEVLDAALQADLAEFAAEDGEPEPEPEL